MTKIVADINIFHRARALCLVAGLATTFFSCASTKAVWNELVGDAAVPLTKFTAADREYFPEFIAKFFEGADKFGERFPAMAEARMKLTARWNPSSPISLTSPMQSVW